MGVNLQEYHARKLFILAVKWLMKFEDIGMKSVHAEYAVQFQIVEEMRLEMNKNNAEK